MTAPARIAFITVTALSITLAQMVSAAAQLIEFKAGIADPASSDLSWWLAEASGFYRQQGLDVEIRSDDGNRALEALLAGRLDVVHRGLSNVVRVNRSGGDLRVIGSLGDKVRLDLVSAPGIRTAADLKGGIIGIGNVGSESDTAVTLALMRLGLSRNDVVIKDYGDSLHRLDLVKSGQIKATTLSEPFTSLARDQGLVVMVNLVGEKIPWVFTGIVATRAALNSRRDALKRFLRGTIEGNYLALTDERRAKEMLAKELAISDPKILDINYREFSNNTPLNSDIAEDAAKNTLAHFPAAGGRLEDYIDASLIDEIRKEGFIASMQQKYNKR